MAITISIDTDRKCSIAELTAEVSGALDPTDDGSLISLAPYLRGLANDRGLIVRKLNEELSNWDAFQTRNNYPAPVLLLATNREFMLRAVIWLPPLDNPQLRNWQEQFVTPHDHSFSFLTVGYWGSGYETTIWEYNAEKIRGEVGEFVEMNLLERTSLPEGKVMMYRASKDIHSQEHPNEFSVSLNLIPAYPGLRPRDSYNFDPVSGRILSHSGERGMTGIGFLCDLAESIGDGNTIEILGGMSSRHASATVRGRAVSSLGSLLKGDRESLGILLRDPIQDPADVVRSSARRLLDEVS